MSVGLIVYLSAYPSVRLTGCLLLNLRSLLFYPTSLLFRYLSFNVLYVHLFVFHNVKVAGPDVRTVIRRLWQKFGKNFKTSINALNVAARKSTDVSLPSLVPLRV